MKASEFSVRDSTNMIQGLGQLSPEVATAVVAFKDIQLHRVKKFVEIALALSAQQELENLLEKIIRESRSLTNADGGTLYSLDANTSSLKFEIVQNETLRISMGGSGEKISWPAVPLYIEDEPNHANVSAHCALCKRVINISDVYNTEDFNFEGTKAFDAGTGFRSRSMLVVPMEDHEGSLIGVMQLINARESTTGAVIDFSPEAQQLTEALASLAAIAITKSRLIIGLETLLESFVTSIAMAIDEKSPYTGGHIRRVAELSQRIAQAVNDATEGPFKDRRFSCEELKEIRMAAWLHDLGKITTPEQVVDKKTRLEKITDRIELVAARLEILRQSMEISLLKRALDPEKLNQITGAIREVKLKLAGEFDFIKGINLGKVRMTEDVLDRLRGIAGEEIEIDNTPFPLITVEELACLSIPYGTLTDQEKETIRNHVVVTARMLSSLPFPKKMRNVPKYAAEHHEKIDRGGYPQGIGGAGLGLQSRIIALADVFEALTAADRPYKKAISLSQSLNIIAEMAEKGEQDADLLQLVLEAGIFTEYAWSEMAPHQVDL